MKPVFAALALAALLGLAPASAEAPDAPSEAPPETASRFTREVDLRLDVPAYAQRAYTLRLRDALAQAGLARLTSQHVVLVDRSRNVQALLLFLLDAQGEARFIGATSISTGSAGRFEHFLTPLGVFAHTLDNPDFRAEGTFNDNGIRGYGERGMRVFDFGWVVADRTWGAGGRSPMRLQMHATDPARLEPRLGRADSKGCIRIPATLNHFIDRYGLLDADYEQALARGERLWMLLPERAPTQWPGRYLVVVDSAEPSRPAWAQPERSRPKPRAGAAAAMPPLC